MLNNWLRPANRRETIRDRGLIDCGAPDRTGARYAMRFLTLATCLVLFLPRLAAARDEPSRLAPIPLLRTVDESRSVELADANTATVKLVGVEERRELVGTALREAKVGVEVNGEDAAPFPGTRPLTGDRDLSRAMLDGLHRFAEHQDRRVGRGSSEALESRHLARGRPTRNPIEPNRESFRRIIGVVDPRLPAAMERFGDDDRPAPGGRERRLSGLPGPLAGP